MLEKLARSELLSTFFPTWLWQGREWSKWRIPKYDPYYWINAHAHPVISTYYPISAIGGVISRGYSVDSRFKFLLYIMLLHVLFGFLGFYFVINQWSNGLVALFGAITFTLASYNWKQQPCYQYTVAWFPWLLLGIAKGSILLSGISFGMILLAGYYPIGIQTALIAGCASILWNSPPYWMLIGTLIGLPQLIPFIKYLPKTIRTRKISDIGKVPWWHFASLVFPKAFRFSINGVGYWEMSYYIGLIPLLTIWYTRSAAVILLLIALLLVLGVCGKHLPRIPARFLYTFQFALIWCAITGLANLNLSNHVVAILCLIQAFDLWHNNSPLLINHPYAELYNKPSYAFNTRLTRFLETNLGNNRVSGLPYPLFTGHINRLKTLGYSGGMQLKLMAKWRHDDNSDGSGQHDFFKSSGDIHDLERVCKYAYTTTRIPWKPTGLKDLWRNPNIS